MGLVNKSNGRRKILWADMNYEYVDTLIKKAERVNSYVAKETLPDRIEFSDTCGICPFRHICLPDTAQKQLEIDNSPKLLELLQRRESLKEQAKEYDEADSEIKEMVRNKEKIACGDFLIIGKAFKQTRYDVPDELKKQYAKQTDGWRVNITRLK